MSGSVTQCLECGAMNWAGKDKCRLCGGELAPTLAQVHRYVCSTDPTFRKQIEEQRGKGEICEQ